MSDNNQTSDPMKGDANVAPRGGVPAPLPPLQRDQVLSRPADGKGK
jgi:hypothetical protein